MWLVDLSETHENISIQKLPATVLPEYFAGEKPLRMSQISRKFDPLQSNYCILARIVCIY